MKYLYTLITLLLVACAPQVETTIKEVSGGQVSENPENFGVVALVYQYSMSVRCTGVVIGPKTILTAAHCVSSDDLGSFEVFEPWKLKVVEKTNYIPEYEEKNVREIKSIIMHEGFPVYWPYSDFDDLGVGVMNDIALINTKERLSTRPMDMLYTRGPPLKSGVTLLVMGYGYILTTHTVRQRFTAGLTSLSYVRDNEFWTFADPASPCGGDGGGPIFIEVDGEWLVAGITSRSGYSLLCTEGAIYTMVPSYTDWIEDSAGNEQLGYEEPPGCSTGTPSGLPILLLLILGLLWRRKRLT